MSDVIASEAKLRITIDTTQAKDDVEELERTSSRRGSQPEIGRPDVRHEDDDAATQSRTGRNADQPYVGGSGPGNMSGRELYNRAQQAFGVVASGRLYETALTSARTLPAGVGTAVQVAELNRQFGAYGRGAAEAIVSNMLDAIPEEALPPGGRADAAKLISQALTAQSKAEQDAMNAARHNLNAVGSALSAVNALAFGKAIKDEQLGLDDVDDLAKFGAEVHRTDVLFAEIDTRKRILFQSKMSGALVNGLFDAVRGNAGR